jgi:hypothetical protein
MNNQKLQLRVRSLTRDLTSSIFRAIDVQDYLNEGIDRCTQVIPQLEGMPYLSAPSDEPILLPAPYHNLLAVYSASRCFFQDERHYQATTLMNEFESKLDELKGKIDSGEIVIKNADGTDVVVDTTNQIDYVEDNYFQKRYSDVDIDLGVEGVE